jgi:hypothetical protein
MKLNLQLNQMSNDKTKKHKFKKIQMNSSEHS